MFIRVGLFIIIAAALTGCCNRGTTTIYASDWYDADDLCYDHCKSMCPDWDTEYVSSGVYDCTCYGVLD